MNILPWPYPLSGYSLEIEELPSLPGGYTWYEIVSFGDHLLALGFTGTTFVSAKLTSLAGSWTLGTPLTDAWFGTELPYGPSRRSSGMYAANCGYMKNITSADGLVWTLVTPDWPADYYTRIGAIGDTFYAAQWEGGEYRLRSSTNAVNWTLVDVAASASWYPVGQPVALGSDIFIPSYTFYSPYDETGPALLVGSTLTETKLATESASPVMVSGGGDAAMFASPELGALGVWGTPGNAAAIAFKSDAASGIRYMSYVDRGNPLDFSIGGVVGAQGVEFRRQESGDFGNIIGLHVFDSVSGVMHNNVVSTVLSNAAQFVNITDSAGWLDAVNAGPNTNGFGFIGPFEGKAILPGFDISTEAPRPAAVNVIFQPQGADVAITELPTAVTGIVGASKYMGGYPVPLDGPISQQIARMGCAVFQIDVPEGASGITMRFPPNQSFDIYCDIYAGQSSTFEELFENYDAPFYGWFYNDSSGEEAHLHSQTIPVSGTGTLTVVFQMYSADGIEGRAMDVTFLQDFFWEGLTNCIEWS